MSTLIYEKMSDVMKDVKAVTKDQKNTAQGYRFRGIDNFINALYPALTKHGVFMTPRCTSYEHELKDVTRGNGKPGVDKHVHILMEYDFYAKDGSKVTVGPIPGESLDSSDKSTNKALSAALKYALIQTFSVPTEDMAEGDLETPEIGVTTSKFSGVIAAAATALEIAKSVTETKMVEVPKTIRKPAGFARKTTTTTETTAPAASVGTATGWE